MLDNETTILVATLEEALRTEITRIEDTNPVQGGYWQGVRDAYYAVLTAMLPTIKTELSR